ncbi:Protein tyrosine and serine/threonine kinase [Popillia japonica]|uniref:Receptor protein-tyrosine kinase n=1 Tax=Popillia japonica TaxID=7064 RepID=A0AAW1IZP6_POPJA
MQHYAGTAGSGAAAFIGSMPKNLTLVDSRESAVIVKKVCIGTNGRMSVPSNRHHHYRNLKERFSNCTYVDGNLELTWMQNDTFDLSFLQYIREVTGYVLISHVDVKKVILPRLQIIRGRTLFKLTVRDEQFALFVTHSQMLTLELPALRDILNGSVGMFSNYNLCHVKTIQWDEIISHQNGSYVYEYNFTSPERECPKCHGSCSRGCWGDGEHNCQKFSKKYCSPQCYGGRCFGTNPRECCHLFCAGGCTGPTQSDCIACKNFYDDGVCTADCPPMQIYDPLTYSWQQNKNGKFAYGATCVKHCPEHLLKDNGACVRTCPSDKKSENGECVRCDGPCPKTCPGDVMVDSGNIESFRGCTIVEGYLNILESTFTGYQKMLTNFNFGDRCTPMHPDRLEVFSSLKEITSYLNIQATHESFKNLSYFRNLEKIGGRELHDYFTSLYIVKTSLESLELRSLKLINSGKVAILENKKLCFADKINWKKIFKSSESESMVYANREDCDFKSSESESMVYANREDCEAAGYVCHEDAGYVCHEECTEDGCWGSGPEQCLSCRHVKFENTCLHNCSVQPRLYRTENKECKRCHEECASACNGPTANNCTTCKNFRDGDICVPKCATGKYGEDGVCKPCHDTCNGGCAGPLSIIGEGGCNFCYKAIINHTVMQCIHEHDDCPDGYFLEPSNPLSENRKTSIGNCRKCHPRCKKCTGYGFHVPICQQCTNYRKGEICEDECPKDHYPNKETHECLPCDIECKGCTGPGSNNCISCENLKVFEDGDPANNQSFTCVSMCPNEYPHRVFPQDSSESYCSETSTQALGALGGSRTPIILISVLAGVSTAFLAVFGVVFYWCRKVKAKEKALKMTMALTGFEDNEPLQPSNVAPNLAKLRIIKDGEMRKGGILGYGAFGTVYKGVWVPEGESNKIPVAIKVLRENAGINTSKEFLSEAYIMASVEHPNLLQLLGVCMTTQMMLITQLMPLGCLLDFVRKNRDKIGSKPLLTWCAQIARGMAYLEEKRLVHRDLAARNVLVQTPSCVKITDFGLAKLLDINEEEYKAAGGKMPIKWLALECIQHRIFTHKSDVWAFGVTVWELLTFGERPYDNTPARDVPELLELGERLPQPQICSIEVYMILLKCWVLDAESRPGFKELADDFVKMCRDPGRYLVIPGDSFMKLSFPNSGDCDTLRNMHHSTDHSHSNSGGEDFLQPKSRAPLPSGLSISGSPSTPTMKFCSYGTHMTSDGSCAPQNQHNWNQERLRFAQTHGLDPNSLLTMNSDASSIRYCGDSLNTKVTARTVIPARTRRCDPGSDEYDSGRSQAQVGNLKLELPLDEDDYLVPSPQQNQNPSNYVDLIGDARNSHADGAAPNSNIYNNRSFSEFSKTNIDNPEYLMNGDTPCQTIGIPTVSEFVQAAETHTNNCASNPAQLYHHPQKSVEEESDHEYYNDFDRLQRELQPLQKKNETAV